jgi:hypothetical protein
MEIPAWNRCYFANNELAAGEREDSPSSNFHEPAKPWQDRALCMSSSMHYLTSTSDLDR